MWIALLSCSWLYVFHILSIDSSIQTSNNDIYTGPLKENCCRLLVNNLAKNVYIVAMVTTLKESNKIKLQHYIYIIIGPLMIKKLWALHCDYN